MKNKRYYQLFTRVAVVAALLFAGGMLTGCDDSDENIHELQRRAAPRKTKAISTKKMTPPIIAIASSV